MREGSEVSVRLGSVESWIANGKAVRSMVGKPLKPGCFATSGISIFCLAINKQC